MKAKLTIVSQGVGWSDRVEAPAEMQSDGVSAEIAYKIDGDDCLLKISADAIEQIRRGSVNIRITIGRGAVTRCEIGEGTSVGGYVVSCKALACTVKALGVNAEAAYFSGNDRELVRLKIRAVAIR